MSARYVILVVTVPAQNYGEKCSDDYSQNMISDPQTSQNPVSRPQNRTGKRRGT